MYNDGVGIADFEIIPEGNTIILHL